MVNFKIGFPVPAYEWRVTFTCLTDSFGPVLRIDFYDLPVVPDERFRDFLILEFHWPSHKRVHEDASSAPHALPRFGYICKSGR